MKKKSIGNKVLSSVLAGGMILSSLVVPGAVREVEAAPGDNLVADYAFDGDFSDSVSGAEGETLNSNPPTIVEDGVRGQVMKSGSGTGRVRTENPLKDADLSGGMTVSAWVDANSVNTWNGVWSFASGAGNTDGFFGMSTNGSLFYNSNPASPSYQDMTQFGGTITADGGWELITVVMDQSQIYMYKDGVLTKSLTPSTNLGDTAADILDFISESDYIWFGTASPYYWSSGDFYMDDFKVYSAALSAEDVLAEYLSDGITAQGIVASDKEALTVASTVYQNLDLPDTGASEYTQITWSSDTPDVIADDGTVTRPEEDTVVTLTAAITLGDVTDTKEFTVTVPKADPQGDLNLYAEQLTLNAGYVSSDLNLPASVESAAVSWSSSDPEAIAPDGTVTRGEKNKNVTLTATLTLEGAETPVTKDFTLVVLAEGGNVASYVSNDPDLSTDGLKGQAGGMKLAAEGDNGYEALHKDQPVMYTALGAKAYVSPQIFRKADGSFALMAADGGNNNTVILYDSDDLIEYTNERTLTLTGISNIAKLYCVYDMTAQEYRLFVENAGGTCYRLTSADLETFSAAERTEFTFPEVTGAPSDAVWASETALTQSEYDKVTSKFTNPYNTSLTEITREITVDPGTDIEAALDEAVGQIQAEYSNGEERTYSVRWNENDLEKADSSRSGMEYTIRGTVGGNEYFTDAEDPLIEERADPCIAYDEDNDRYYFTASYPVNGKDGADGYDRLVIRVADTIEGLADAQEYVIWDESENEGFGQFIWAPELHKIGDSWYFLSTAARVETGYSFDLRPFIMKCNNPDDITNPDSWGEPQRLKLHDGDTSGLNAMSLDMTYFEVGDKCYYAWADFTRNSANPNGVSSIYIATVDPSDPTQLTSDCSVIAVPEYTWETVRYTVNEGPSVIQHDGKVYMAFSASGTGAEYCVGLLTADANADLLNPDSWTKTPYPVLTSGDFNNELCGPGHNSFTVDENGDPVIVYHARPAAEHATHSGDPLYDACRHAYVKPVLFDSEGVPVLNLSDEEFAMGGSAVTVTVKISGELEETTPVLEYNFDEDYQEGTAADSAGDNNAVLTDGATYVQDDSYGQVLYLDGDDSIGGSNGYLAFPQGFFDGMDSMTISMDVNEVSRSGDYFTFAIGQDRNKYLLLKVEPEKIKMAITTNTWSGEQTATVEGVYPNNSRTWINLKMVITPGSISLYRDGQLVASNENITISISDLGENLKAYLGKSFYDEDLSFRGFYDNVKVYDYAMTDAEVQQVYQQEEEARMEMLSDVQRVADLFEIPDADDIRGNITLPSEKDGVNIAWTSSDENVISTAVVENENYDDTPAGVVTRGDADQDVTLTATFSKDGQESVTRTYTVTVKAAPEAVSEDDYVGYLFVHFTGSESSETDEQTYFSISQDGLNWTDLNSNEPVLQSTIGESGLRDHFIARSADGDKYYMIATDLSIYNNRSGQGATGWAGAGGSGSHGIVVWESDDLVNWSEPWIAEIAPENAGCTWAPEFIYDAKTGEYVVYWSATTIELDENNQPTQVYENHTIYYAKTRDFRTFTDPQVYHSGGKQADGTPIKVIDSTMIENNGTYYRYTKNEMNGTIMVDKSDAILGEFTTIDSQTLSSDLPAAQGAVEGPIIFKMNEKTEDGQDQWCLMVDRYGRGQGYYPLITTDLDSGEFTMLDESQFSMPSKYRHGYVMPITASEYDALVRTYGDGDIVSTYKLEQTIAAAEAIDQSTLTAQSAADLQAAIDTAKAALETVATTAEADAAAETLQNVIDSLNYAGDVKLTSITVKAPYRTEYKAGDELSLDGMTVTAVYSDGTEKDVTAQAVVTGYEGSVLGDQTITVSYTENSVTVTGTFQVTVTIPYLDVNPDDYFYDAAVSLYEKGIMTGIDAKHFGPTVNVARAQFVTMLYRMAGSPEVSKKADFADVPRNQWFSDAVAWAVENGIVTGYTNGNFGPSDLVTREQIATMLYRYAGSPENAEGADVLKYPDAGQVSDFAQNAMIWAVENGIITGQNSGTILAPQSTAYRAEAATMVARYLG